MSLRTRWENEGRRHCPQHGVGRWPGSGRLLLCESHIAVQMEPTLAHIPHRPASHRSFSLLAWSTRLSALFPGSAINVNLEGKRSDRSVPQGSPLRFHGTHVIRRAEDFGEESRP